MDGSGIVIIPEKRTSVEKKIGDCVRNCVNAGIVFASQVKDSMVVFPINIRGLVSENEMVVPSSELAISEGADGKKLLAWSVLDHRAHIIYESEGCCNYTHGLPEEVLSKRVREITRGVLE
jgi:hypothetical protein